MGLCSLIRKKQTIIKGNVDVRTTDGYIVRMFCIAFTKQQENQCKVTCYAQATQIRAIGGKTGEQIIREGSPIFPLKDCFIRKVKVLKKPKFDVTSLMEWHTEEEKDVGAGVSGPAP